MADALTPTSGSPDERDTSHLATLLTVPSVAFAVPLTLGQTVESITYSHVPGGLPVDSTFVYIASMPERGDAPWRQPIWSRRWRSPFSLKG